MSTFLVSRSGRQAIAAFSALLAAALHIPGAAAQSDAQAQANTSVAEKADVDQQKRSPGQAPATGSLIKGKKQPPPAPIQILTREQWDESGKFNLGDFLQTLPEQGNALNRQSNNGADGTTPVNLRSLGTGNTLVLVDGKRMVSSFGAAVDINTLPDAAVDRIEVLKDGASASYGSGAVAGVVNIVTRRGFEGSEAHINYGESSRGDVQTAQADFLTGHPGERGSYLLTASLFDQRPAYAGDRIWSAYDLTASAGAYDFYTGTTPFPGGSSRTPQGAVVLPYWDPGCLANALCNALVSTGNDRFIRDPGAPLGWRDFNVPGDLYNYVTPTYLITPAKRAQVFLDGDFRFNNARAYYQAWYTRHDSEQQLAPTPLDAAIFGIPVSADNLYNPFGVDLWDVRRRLVEFGPRTFRENFGTYRVVAGLDGTFETSGPFAGWTWDVAANYGRSSGSYDTVGDIRISRLISAIGPSMLVNGMPRCVSTPGDASSVIPGCVPLDLFDGPGSIDQAQIDWLGFNGRSRIQNSLLSLTGNISGNLFTLPSGNKAALALGYEFRREQDTLNEDPVVATGDAYGNTIESVSGAQSSREIRAELALPFVMDTSRTKLAEIDLAGNYAHYDTFGGIFSYKASGEYASTSGLALHGSYSHSFRAPRVDELFTGGIPSFAFVVDPCADFSAVPATIAAQCVATGVPAPGSFDYGFGELVNIGGNPKLGPEKSKAITAGVTYEPPSISGLSFNLDYYRIRLHDLIGSLGANLILVSCYPFDQRAPAPQACSRIVRDPVTGQILYINDTLSNAGSMQTSGLDFGVRAELPTSIGKFGFALDASRVNHYNRTVGFGFFTIHGVGNYDLGSLPRQKANIETTWQREDWKARLGARYVGSFRECQDNDCSVENPLSRHVGASVVLDGQVSHTFPHWSLGQTSVAIGVNNLFDRSPPRIVNAFEDNSDGTLYDFVGRFVYIRISEVF